jgi:hypothetical protein
MCNEDLCDQAAKTRGRCHTHYVKWLREGGLGKHCIEDGCTDWAVARGRCNACYLRWRRANAATTCRFEGCPDGAVLRGWCNKHYHRIRKTGNPAQVQMIRGDDAARFWSYVDVDGDCWEWTGQRDRDGYGRLWRPAGKTRVAHRIAYELLVGPIPEGLQLDHLCLNKCCVNPDHVEPVTLAENCRRRDLARTAT